jgi:signal transduction histidine kinase
VITLALAASCLPLLGQANPEELRERLQTAEGAHRVRILNDLAKAVQGNAPEESLDYAREALDLARSIRDREAQVKALNNIGVGHYFLAEYDEAMEFYRTSLGLAEEIGYDEGIANALNNTGVLYYVWGDYDRALDYYSRSLEIRKRTGDRLGTAKGLNNLGSVSHAAGRYEEALQYLGEAFAAYEELGEERYGASSLANMGLAEFELGRYDEARSYLQRALEIQERIGDDAGLAFSLNNIGMVQGAREEHREALELYRRSLDVRERIGDRQGAAICRLNMGVTNIELGQPREAAVYLRRALQEATEINVLEIQRDAWLGLSEAYEAVGETDQALEAYRRHAEVVEALFTEQTSRRLAEMKTRHEVEKKDREIEDLRRERRFQQLVRNVSLVGSVLLLLIVVLIYNRYRLKDRANREMQKANEALHLAQAEREKTLRAELSNARRVATTGELSSVLAHELRQPLTAILSNAQATRRLMASGRSDPAELDEALADIVDGADRAREVIKRLRDLIHHGEIRREPMDVNNAIREVQALAATDALEHGVRLVLELDPDLPRVSGDSIQLQQVLLNLVHNGAEAMARVGETDQDLVVRTSLQDESTVLIAVVDSGPPPDDGTVDRMFEPFFTTKSDGLGMGLPICASIIEAHDGRLWATPDPERGMTVQFALPVAAS